MTVEINDTIERYTISGVGPYAFSFRVFDEDELAVVVDTGTVDATPLAISSHYTVEGVNEDEGGTVTLDADTATLYAGSILDIRSNTIEYQPTSIRNQGSFLSSLHEDEFDRLARQIQDLRRSVRNSLRLPDTTLADGIMSPLSAWAGKFPFVNDDGEFEPAVAIALTVLTQSIIGALLNPQTPAEAAATVTPAHTQYQEGDDRRYSSFDDFLAVVQQNVEGHIWTDHSIATAIDLSGDAVLIGHGHRRITATALMDYMIRHAGELTIEAFGELLFDGDNKVAFSCLHSTNKLPDLKNVRFLDADQGWATGANLTGVDYGVIGDGVLENVTAENCGDVGFSARGNVTAASRTATLIMRNCNTKGTTGSGDFIGAGVGFLAQISGMYRVRWEGGEFRGASDASITNAFECSHAEIEGGTYINVGRGATVGRNTQNFSIRGVVGFGLSVQGVSADTTDGVGVTDGIGIIDGCIISNSHRCVRTTCSYVSVTNCRGHENTATNGDFVFAGDGAEVWVDGNTSFRTTTAFVAFSATENTTVTYGVNYTNSTSRNNFSSPSSVTSQAVHLVPCGAVRSVVADTDLRGSDRIIVADTTATAVDIDIFDATEVRATGFYFEAIHRAGLNTLTITIESGGIHGETIITPTGSVTGVSVSPSQFGQRWRFDCIDGPAGTWIATPPGLTYIQSASTVFDPASLADGAGQGTDITVTGATIGDFAAASFSNDTQEILLDAQVTATDTVTVRFQNETGGTLDLGNGNIRAMVWRKM